MPTPRGFASFWKSSTGLMILFAILLGFAIWGLGAWRQSSLRAGQAASRKAVPVGEIDPTRGDVDPDSAQTLETVPGQFVPYKPVPPQPKLVPPAPVVATAKKTQQEKPKLPNLVLFYNPPPAELTLPAVSAPEVSAPYGTLIKCKTILTVDSSSLKTPVLALVTEDVWYNSRLIIPAGTEVNGFAANVRNRDRVEASGTWRFVWPDGREYAISALALDREYDQGTDGYGITDGSAGLKGRILKADEYQELKLFAGAFVQGLAQGTQQRETSLTGASVSVASVENGARQGAANVGQQYAQLILDSIEKEGYFVRIPSGKEFYLYAQQVIEPDLASIANLKQGEDGATSYGRAQHERARLIREDEARRDAASGGDPVQRYLRTREAARPQIESRAQADQNAARQKALNP